MNTTMADKIIEQLRSLPGKWYWRALRIARILIPSAHRGVPGHNLLRFAGAIPLDDTHQMREAIEQGCEQINIGDW